MAEILTTAEAEALRDDATEIIKGAGSDVVVKTQTGSTYDVTTGTTVPTFSTSTIKSIISSYESNEMSNLIVVGDIKLMITSDDIAKITQGSIITIDENEYSVKDIQPNITKNIKMYADVQVRK